MELSTNEDRDRLIHELKLISDGIELDNVKVRRELLDVMRLLRINDSKIARRMATSLFNDRDAEFFIQYVYRFRKYLKTVVIAPHYLEVVLEGEIRVGGRTGNIRRMYIVGVNDYKDTLFVNEVNTYVGKYDLYYDSNGIAYKYADDSDFREAFGYDVDVLTPRITLGVDGDNFMKSFRVSGEVVFEVVRADIDYYVERLFKDHVRRYIAYLVSDFIARLLLDNGFSIPSSPEFAGIVPNTVRLFVPGAVTRNTNLEKVKMAFKRMLEDYFTTVEMKDGGIIRASTDDFDVIIDLNVDYRYGEPRGDLVIDISMPFDPDAENRKYYVEIMSDIKKNVRELMSSEQTHVVHVGNHLIRLENALPINFTYEPKIKPVFYPPISITVFNPMEFIVTPKTKIVIEHVEHGAREITFDDTYVLRIRTTNVANDYIEKRNVLALRRLMTQYT
jgi:hypothetical protein